MLKTEGRCKCGKTYTKQYHNKILVSRQCPDCRYETEYAKRKEALSKKKTGKTKVNPLGKFVMKASVATKYENKSINSLLKLATYQFNKFIRNRDRMPGNVFICPTCTTNKIKRIEGNNYQACHCFPAGFYPCLRFNELNVYGGCLQCNYFKHGTNYEFNDWVRNKIGDELYNDLLNQIAYWTSNTWRWDRFYLIEIIEKYKLRNTGFEDML